MTEAVKLNKYGPVVAEVVSQRSGETYQVRKHLLTNALSCQCAGWRFSKSDPRSCKHTRAYRMNGSSAEINIPSSLDLPTRSTPRPAVQPMPAAFEAIDRVCRAELSVWLSSKRIDELRAALKLALGPHVLPVEAPATVVAPAAQPGIRRIVLAD